jgi:putative membrane protein
MTTAAAVLAAIVALLHLYFLVLESFLWTHPLGRKTFRLSEADAATTRTLAMNQGLYNGFLAAGLVWSLVPGPMSFPLRVFFLGCVILAGIVGAATVNRRIFWVQAFPAILGLGLAFLGRS